MAVWMTFREPLAAPRMTGGGFSVGRGGRGKIGYACQRCARSGLAMWKWRAHRVWLVGGPRCAVPDGRGAAASDRCSIVVAFDSRYRDLGQAILMWVILEARTIWVSIEQKSMLVEEELGL